jgi:GTP-binding protein
MIKGKRLKIYYGLQVSTNPQTIRLFVNDPKLVTPAYLSFIEKNIRARFGLEGAPLRIFLKARSRNTGSRPGAAAGANPQPPEAAGE